MIFGVAPIAVYLAMPFFRQIDATSAYEYLQKRFNMPVRLFGSASFMLFHVFRMGIVMSLAALALSTVADFSFMLGWIGLGGIANANAVACILIMGVLSIIYCTMGGVEAVVWTDTIQTFVLLGGGLLCFILMIQNVDGGLSGFIDIAAQNKKVRMVNLHWDSSSTSLALWVVLIGAFGQNLSSYTADQAIVQRYMTTPDRKRAAKAIWTNAWMCIPASLLFYATGTALFAFYKSHPEKLDPTYMTDQIFPLFISHEVPLGIAGLIVAGIFAAAQSTISTSMNSLATTFVTDFVRPLNVVKTEKTYLNIARTITLTFGIIGTLLGLLFVSPDIKSLFDQFIKIVGLFMGVLGGLFCLGMLTRRANGWGALTGAIFGALVMLLMPIYTSINGYLYAFIGIGTCFVVGYLASIVIPSPSGSIEGLTIHTVKREE
jgi:SSS family transporter